MKKHFIITLSVVFLFLRAGAQNENYISLESGHYYGNANKHISAAMTQSGFGDYRENNSSWIDFITGNLSRGQFPYAQVGKLKYRVRAGHWLNKQNLLEAGFGLAYYGTVGGYDKMTSGTQSNRLTITSRINMAYVTFTRSNPTHRIGLGAGPAFSLYKLRSVANNNPDQTKSYLLPGGMATGFWNFISKKSWFVGVRGEMTLTTPVKINEIRVTNTDDPSFVSTFNTTKAGSFNSSIALNAGVKF